MSEYWTSSGITVYDFDKCILALKKRHEDQLDRIKYLEEENRKLKDDAYKDAEMARMKSQYEEMKADYYRGFPITENEKKQIDNFINKYRGKNFGAIGGAFTYKFTPTSIGIAGEVIAPNGESFTFKELS